MFLVQVNLKRHNPPAACFFFFFFFFSPFPFLLFLFLYLPFQCMFPPVKWAFTSLHRISQPMELQILPIQISNSLFTVAVSYIGNSQIENNFSWEIKTPQLWNSVIFNSGSHVPLYMILTWLWGIYLLQHHMISNIPTKKIFRISFLRWYTKLTTDQICNKE